MKHSSTDTHRHAEVLDREVPDSITRPAATPAARDELALLDAADRLFDAQRPKDAATWLDHAKQRDGE